MIFIDLGFAYVCKQYHKDAFNLLKGLLISASILLHPDYNLEFLFKQMRVKKDWVRYLLNLSMEKKE